MAVDPVIRQLMVLATLRAVVSIMVWFLTIKYDSMNVLILTPDRVGSTLLQRLITVYMNMHNFDQPVINLHELTNGLIKYYNSRFNQELF